ncbi:cupin domain-containing protein [Saccharothrix variisporea]|uniref:Mannose-6-phosphate isomerase-like protein (Cupin superfamily) n=1 Tax=Saccharothrix variisporea TaxID=543527 RepID=A0A495XHQ3_9PSEU|nr:cupin domain-containing protein [Saccharothrix variisporea]RKT72696.1 mannose-6-phosphate isomerase-like protein (cupin superfamily) [Saccharothrix variisporea]
MIVTPPAAPSRTLAGGGSVAWRCLVRRGMLHSETESVDHVRLPAGAVFAPPGTDGVESAWLVLRGSGTVNETAVGPGDVVLVPAGGALRAGGEQPAALEAGAGGLEFLWVAVLPAAVSDVLPPRSPVAS